LGLARFDDPIPTPKGKTLRTLKDAAAYILALPKREAEAQHWQVAMEQTDRRRRRSELHHARADRNDAGIKSR
jgi:hypothetical protein